MQATHRTLRKLDDIPRGTSVVITASNTDKSSAVMVAPVEDGKPVALKQTWAMPDQLEEIA